ncbi:MAG: hypothetical protein JNL21_32535 [Myxococcales bacterium]|nr:hypothetical protein [Myxococcales bacterium]
MGLARFPLLSRYLDGLPAGLASYPEAQAKGSVIRVLVTTAPVRVDPDELPSELAVFLERPPLPTAWVSEVQLNALGLVYEDAMPHHAYEAWVWERNRAILTNPLYKILFWMISPERLFVGLPHRWSAFRRGTELALVDQSAGRARLRLTFPKNLHDKATLANVCVAGRVVAEAAGAKASDMVVESYAPTSAVFAISWA